MATKPKETKSSNGAGVITLPAPKIIEVNVKIVGTSSLIVHKWSDKAKKEILDKQMKKAKQAKAAKDPEADYRSSLYFLDEEDEKAGYGFPSVAFKSAVVRAGTYADLKMTFLRGAFHVLGELVEIDGTPVPREDPVRLASGGSADLRYRGEFDPWSATIPIELNELALSVEQLANLFQTAGFAVGVGEWRPERNGQHGRFNVAEVTR